MADTTKWRYLFDHFWPSLMGWPFLFLRSPVFAVGLLFQRAFFFVFRRIPFISRDNMGFLIDTPSVLNSYWNMFVERSLLSREWTRPFRQHPNPLVIDIGANAGVFTHLLTVLNPVVKVIAVEPLPAMASRIETRAELTSANVRVHRLACSNVSGQRILYTASSDDTTASLEKDNCSGKQTIEVKVDRVDSIIGDDVDVFLAKIDAEGHEESILEGAAESLKRTRFLIIEANSDQNRTAIKSVLEKNWTPLKLDSTNYLFANKSI